MARKARQHYISGDEFKDALLEAQSLGEPTVRLCNLFRLLISRYLSGPRYSGYDAATLEDLASTALLKCLKNLKNYKQERGSAFSYFTLATECSCKDSLGKFYRNKNLIRELGGLSKTEWQGSLPLAAPNPNITKNVKGIPPKYPPSKKSSRSNPRPRLAR